MIGVPPFVLHNEGVAWSSSLNQSSTHDSWLPRNAVHYSGKTTVFINRFTILCRCPTAPSGFFFYHQLMVKIFLAVPWCCVFKKLLKKKNSIYILVLLLSQCIAIYRMVAPYRVARFARPCWRHTVVLDHWCLFVNHSY